MQELHITVRTFPPLNDHLVLIEGVENRYEEAIGKPRVLCVIHCMHDGTPVRQTPLFGPRKGDEPIVTGRIELQGGDDGERAMQLRTLGRPVWLRCTLASEAADR